jgi:hypothetical protein
MKKATKPATKGAAGKPAAKPAAKPAGRKPIYVTDPNDKRLKSYQDSLKTYKLVKPYVNEAVRKVKSAKTRQEFEKISYDVADKYMNAGMNPDILKDGKVVVKTQYGYLVNLVAKKPTRPVLLKKGEAKKELPKKEVKSVNNKTVSKTSVAPKELKKPSPSIKVERTVKLPSGIRDVKYDTQKGTVLVNLDGTQKSMPRKDFDKWVNQPENRKMFNEYRSKKAKKK